MGTGKVRKAKEKSNREIIFAFDFYLKGTGNVNHRPTLDTTGVQTVVSMEYSSGDCLSCLYPEKVEDAWKLFYDHCTFQEILDATTDRIKEHNRPPITIRSRFPVDPEDLSRMSKENWDAAARNYKAQILEAIRDNPAFLYRSRSSLRVLERILETARWSADRAKAREARCLLEDHLLPDYKEHKASVLPSSKVLRSGRRLLIYLARHLSQECKRSLREYMRDESASNKDLLNEWQECYDHVVSWSRQNNGRIYIIAKGSQKLLKNLITHPSDYVNTIMAGYFQVSLRTLKSKIKDRM